MEIKFSWRQHDRCIDLPPLCRDIIPRAEVTSLCPARLRIYFWRLAAKKKVTQGSRRKGPKAFQTIRDRRFLASTAYPAARFCYQKACLHFIMGPSRRSEGKKKNSIQKKNWDPMRDGGWARVVHLRQAAETTQTARPGSWRTGWKRSRPWRRGPVSCRRRRRPRGTRQPTSTTPRTRTRSW